MKGTLKLSGKLKILIKTKQSKLQSKPNVQLLQSWHPRRLLTNQILINIHCSEIRHILPSCAYLSIMSLQTITILSVARLLRSNRVLPTSKQPHILSIKIKSSSINQLRFPSKRKRLTKFSKVAAKQYLLLDKAIRMYQYSVVRTE